MIRQLLFDLRTRLAALLGRGALRRRVDEEMRLHLDLRADQLVGAGLSPEDARAAARRQFGNTLVLRERSLDQWRYGFMETLLQDVRHAVRLLVRSPGFTLVAVLSLALGIGANVAIFSLIDRVILRLLPVKEPDRLVLFAGLHPYPRFEFFQDSGRNVFADTMGFAHLSQVGLDGSEDAASFAEGRLVTGNYFDLLGVPALVGRTISETDNLVAGGHPVVVISHAFWQRHFNGDTNVLGRTIRLSVGRLSSGSGTGGFAPNVAPAPEVAGGRFQVIGVTPPGFAGETVGQHPDFWTPMMMQEHFMPGRPWLERRTASWVRVMARLAPGVSRQQAQARTTLLLHQALLDEEGGTVSDARRQEILARRLELVDGDKGYGPLRSQFRQPLTVLMVMVAVVLLIACANLANLLLARAANRRREIGLRLAMGARRSRVIRQLVTESLVLALAGGAAAVAVAWWGSQFMFAMVSEGNSANRLDLTPDARVLAFTAGVACLTALLFGLSPAFRATRLDLASALREGGRSVTGGWTMGRVLVAVQVALSMMLLLGTALFTRTMINMKSLDLGYSPQNILLMRADPISAGYRGEDIGRQCLALLQRIRTLPGVTMATFSENGLFSGTESSSTVDVEGFKSATEEERVVRFDQVGPGYFTNVGIPILVGRDIADTDLATSQRVVVINQNMARFYYGDRNPIGGLIRYDAGEKDPFVLTVVGVAGNARDHGLRGEVFRRMYVPFTQPVDGLTGANFEVRTGMDPAAMAQQLRGAVREVAPRMPVLDIKPLTTLIDENILRERMIARLSILFGVMALVLATVGLYGVLAYTVARRTNEIGIRMAVGAMRRDVVLMVLRDMLTLVTAGIIAGVTAALWLGSYVESLLFGLQPNDRLTIAIVVGMMVAVALAAAVVPARRAATVDPVQSLRCD